jgi:hypothetical protein
MKTATKTILLLVITSLALFMGCSGEEGPTAPGAEQTFPDDFNPAAEDNRGEAVLEPEILKTGRNARRLSVDNLRRSIPLLFGGITWTARVQNREVEVFDRLSLTLGEADYIQVTENNSEPNPLFSKFMDDMAGQVCGKAVARDQETNEASERLVARFPNDPAANLRFLRLKLHGIYVPEDSTEGLEDLIRLHEEVIEDTNDTTEAWKGVCIAMLTSPEFMAY